MTYQQKYKREKRISLMIETESGRMVHLSEITDLQVKPFKDENGLIQELADPGQVGTHIWGKVNDEVILISLQSKFNCESLGVDMNAYAGLTDPPYTEKCKRMIVDTWAELHHSEFKNYFGLTEDY